MAERTIPPKPTALDDEFDRLTVDTSTLVANLSGYADRVGIGTATPSRDLHIAGDDTRVLIESTAANNNAQITLQTTAQQTHIGANIKENGSAWEVVDGTAGNLTRLHLDASGNLGIGVSDPDHTLELAGVLHVSDEVAAPSAPSSGDGGCIYVKSDGKLYYISDTVAETDVASGGTGTVTSVTAAADSGSGTAITSSGTFTYTGGTGVTTSVSGTTVTVAADNNGTVTSVTPAADSGSGTAITASGTLTYTGGTGVTTSVSGTTVTVDADNNGTVTSVTPGADSGSGTAITGSGTITVSGTANEVDTSVSGTTVTVGLPAAVTLGTSLTCPVVDASSAVLKLGNSTATGVEIGTGTITTTIKNDLLVTDSSNTVQTFLTLRNNDTTADADAGAAMQMTLSDEAGTNSVAARIQATKEAAWDSTDATTIDSSLGFSTIENNVVTQYMQLSSAGQLQLAKDADADYQPLVLTNNSDANDTTGQVSIQFNLNDTDDDQNLPAGKIQVVKEAAWTGVDATHDSAMRFELAENGTQSEKMTLDSAGKLSIDGDFKVSGNDIEDSGDNNIIGSDGSGNIDIAASAKTTSIAGPTVHAQGIRQAFVQISAAGPTALDATNTWINAVASSNQVDLTLPSAAGVGGGFLLYINDFNGTGGTNNIVVTRDGSDTIGGAATSKTIAMAGGHLWLISNGATAWGVISELLS